MESWQQYQFLRLVIIVAQISLVRIRNLRVARMGNTGSFKSSGVPDSVSAAPRPELSATAFAPSAATVGSS
uniref:Putative secreted peptide n=1 Tax=Anopheles braziliensis TaxID=58242 RepID=A0A2M3ZUM4_9DIPT